MKKLNWMVLVAIMVIATLNVSAQNTLRYKLKIGQTYGLKQMTVQNIEQNISGMTQNIKNTLGGDITVTILEKNGDVYSSEMIFKSMIFKMESPMMNMSYDSTDETADASNPLNKTFDLIVGHKFLLKFDDRGNILEVKGFEAIGDKITSTFGENQQQAEMMKKQLGSQFSDENMKGSLSTMFIVYPEEKIKVGTKWTHNSQVKKPVTINNVFNYTVDQMGKENVSLSGSGTMATEEGQTMQQMGMTQHFDLKGDLSFTASVDAKTGWPSEIKMNQNLDGVVAIESPQLATPMEMPMKINSESTFTSF